MERMVRRVKFIYNDSGITIKESYKVKTKVYMEYLLNMFVIETGYKSRRSMKSWIREWVAHNRMYRWGWFRSHTEDCDLEEDIVWWRSIVYFILGGIG